MVKAWRWILSALCRYSAEAEAHILWGANVKSTAAAEELVERLNAKALRTRDASQIEAVQVCLCPACEQLVETLVQVDHPGGPPFCISSSLACNGLVRARVQGSQDA